MSKFKLPKGIVTNIVFTIVGFVLGLTGSKYFYDKGVAEEKAGLIDSAVLDISVWRDSSAYRVLYDSAKYNETLFPWPKLRVGGLEELSRNMFKFREPKELDRFLDLVANCKTAADGFNDRIALRNMWVVQRKPDAPELNASAYTYFHVGVLPDADSLLQFIRENRSRLIDN